MSQNFKFRSGKEVPAELLRRYKERPSLYHQVVDGAPPETTSRQQFLFAPNFATVARVSAVASPEEFGEERSMYSATPEFARENGGPLTRAILDKIPSWYYARAKTLGLYPNIDVRVHDLDLHQAPPAHELYPAIPGWHADGEFRETYFAQPDLNKVPVSFHIIATVASRAGGVSNTEFLLDPITLDTNESLPDSALWQSVHRYVESLPSRQTKAMEDGAITLFDARSLHRATPTRHSGTRLFFRMSMWHKPNLENGQLGKQEQLYLLPRLKTPRRRTKLHAVEAQAEIAGRFPPVETIGDLALEQSLVHAPLNELKLMAGPVVRRLVDLIPPKIVANLNQNFGGAVADLLVFRLYPGYRPYFPDYAGRPASITWQSGNRKNSPEVWLSVSSHHEGVSHTQFASRELRDGEIYVTTSAEPRRELAAHNRGWRLMLRVRRQTGVALERITQQFINPQSECTGW